MKKSIPLLLSILSCAGLVSAAHAAPPNDAQIAAIVVAANAVDIDAGKLAQSKTSSKTSVNRQATALVQKLKVTPEENDTSASLKKDGGATLARLKGMSGKAFDKAYVDNEVAYHQTVLDALDKTLIPGAANAELKALLVKVRPAFVAHLEHARHLQGELK